VAGTRAAAFDPIRTHHEPAIVHAAIQSKFYIFNFCYGRFRPGGIRAAF
jgi:hypothetical protein